MVEHNDFKGRFKISDSNIYIKGQVDTEEDIMPVYINVEREDF